MAALRKALEGVIARITASPFVVRLQRILARYDAAGGGLLANGLAYAALFAIVPATLLLIGIAGFIIADPETRAVVVEAIGAVLPPIQDLLEASLDQLSREASTLSIIGLIGLIWGASRFYEAFEIGLSRVLGRGRRNPLARLALGLGSVVVLVGAVIAGVALASVASILEVWIPAELDASGWGDAIGLVSGALGVAIAIGAVTLIYRFVPPGRVAWSSVVPPAVVVATVLVILIRIFVFLAPRMVGSAALLGTLASVFAALIWLSLTFQALLIGAAWVAERESVRRARLGLPPIVLGMVVDPVAAPDGESGQSA